MKRWQISDAVKRMLLAADARLPGVRREGNVYLTFDTLLFERLGADTVRVTMKLGEVEVQSVDIDAVRFEPGDTITMAVGSVWETHEALEIW